MPARQVRHEILSYGVASCRRGSNLGGGGCWIATNIQSKRAHSVWLAVIGWAGPGSCQPNAWLLCIIATRGWRLRRSPATGTTMHQSGIRRSCTGLRPRPDESLCAARCPAFCALSVQKSPKKRYRVMNESCEGGGGAARGLVYLRLPATP